MKKLIILGILSYIGLVFFTSCKSKEGELFHVALGLNKPRVIVSSSVAGSQIIAMYDENGERIGILHDYTADAGTPRGLVPWGSTGFVAAIDGLNQFDLLDIDGTRSTWSTNAQVSGNFYDMTKDANDYYYVIETNSIEKYDYLGNRIPPSSATPYINTTLGGCTLSTPTSMTINSSGQLVVTNNATSTISVYNLTTPATCASQTAFGNNPRAVLSHSNGSLYIVTQSAAQETLWKTDSTGGSPVSLFANNTTILQDGFAIAELPSGNILVSSSGTDSIVEFTQDGTFVRNFAKDAYTNDVYDIIVIGGN